MSTTTDLSLPEATALFRHWRSTRARGERIPPDLWAAACVAAHEHGVSRTSTALGLDYYALKRQVDRGRRPNRPCAQPGAALATRSRLEPLPVPAFVELPVAISAQTSAFACTIIVEPCRGDSPTARLRIELPAITTADLASLVERWSLRP